MKTKSALLALLLFFSAYSFAQMPKTVKPNYQPKVAEKKMPATPAPAKQNTPAPVNTDLISASASFATGDDGKDHDTYFRLQLQDNNHRIAAGMPSPKQYFSETGKEYFTGSNETISMPLLLSIPTGEVKQVANIPVPIERMATVSDFSAGGELRIDIITKGNDTWKIKTVTLRINFNNDPGSPHEITWNNITLSQDSRFTNLYFDKNFNAIQ